MSDRVCVFGEVLFDCFPDGREVLGGAPFNVAWHLQAFGQSPIFISRVGEDEAGQRVREAMHDWGLREEGLQTDPLFPTGRVTVTLEGGEPSYDIVSNSAFDAIDVKGIPAVAPSLIYHGTLALRSPASSAALEALKSQTEALIFVDVNLRAPWWQRERVLSLVDGADWVKLNRDELVLLYGDDGDPLVAAEQFRDAHGLRGVVLTLGAEGAVGLVAGQAPVRVVPQAVNEVVDAVGAGDAFASVLVLGLTRGWPLATTLDRAQSLASELVKRRGATVSEPAFYQSITSQWGTLA